MNRTPSPETEPADHHSADTDPALLDAIDFARAGAVTHASDPVGDHVRVVGEDANSATHLFEANRPGYGGWCWAVTVANSGPGTEVTLSEVVLLPGTDALVAPEWVPWQYRVQAGDLGVGDLLPTSPDDPRLVPGYLWSEDPAIEDTAMELGLGRERVLSRFGRLDAADRWHDGDFGPTADMAKGAPAHCCTCGFYLLVAGSLGAAFGVCGNEISPADGRAVHAEYGCGAHSEADVEQVSPVLVADLIYDDALLYVEAAEVAVVVDADEPVDAEGDAVEGDIDAAEADADAAVVDTAVDAEPAEAPSATEE